MFDDSLQGPPVTWLFTEVSANPLNWFRLALGASLALKTVIEWYRGYSRYFDLGGYLRYVNRNKPVSIEAYRLFYWLRPFGIVGLILGGPYRALSLILLVHLAVEMRLYFKYHANLMFLFTLLFLLSPDEAWLNPLELVRENAEIMRLHYLPFAATVCAVYIFTAIHKMNRSFLSGEVIRSTLLGIRLHRRLHLDHLFPSRWVDHILRSPMLSISMFVTVGLEFTLPFLLFDSHLFTLALFAGAVLHFGFTCLFPATLAHFSIMMVSSYAVFIPLRF